MGVGRVLIVVLLLCVSTAPVLAQTSGQVVGRPELSLSVADNHVTPGQRTQLDVSVSNDGLLIEGGPVAYEQRVTTARDVVLEVDDGKLSDRYSGDIQAKSGPVAAGNVPGGVAGPYGFVIEVAGSVDPGTYEIPIELRYQYTSFVEYSSTGDAKYRDINRRVTEDVTIVVEDRPRFEVRNLTADVFLGDTGTVRLDMANVGTQPATNARVTLQSQNPSVTFDGAETATMYVGDWPVDARRTITVPMTTGPRAVSKGYAIRITPTFETPNGVTGTGTQKTVGIVPAAGRRFDVVESTADVSVGERGSLALTLTNRGEGVERAAVTVTSASPGVTFVGQSTAAQYVGTWESGEERTVTAVVRATNATDAGEHVVRATVDYAYANGSQATSSPVEASVRVAPEQTFAIQDVGITLRGNTALLTGQVRNTGTKTVDSAVVSLEATGPAVSVRDPTVPVGSLEPNATARVTFDLRVSPDAYPGPRRFDARVQYDRGGNTYVSDPIPVSGPFRTDTDLFAVEPVNATFGIDSSNLLRVRVTNTGEETFTDVRARIANIAPYESEGASSYVGTLAPGESALLAFEVTTPQDAVPTRDAIAMNISAESPDGQTIAAGPYQVPITIRGAGPASGNLITLVVGAVIVFALLGAGWWWLNR